MKFAATLTAITLGLASIGMAQADSLSAPGHDPYYPALQVQSSQTHAQVQQELRQAQANGLVTSGQDPYYPTGSATSTQTRAQVVQDLRNAGGIVSSAGHNAYYPAKPTV